MPVAKKLVESGADIFGVGSLEEAITLRKAGISASIIILSAVPDSFCDLLIEHKLIPTIIDIKFAKRLNQQAKKRNCRIPGHVKIDTGMGRLGLDYKDAGVFIRELSQFKNINLEGIYTHFPAADSDPSFTQYQIEVFNQFINQLKLQGFEFKFRHCANSSGLLSYRDSHFNMVRPGLILYGVKPETEIDIGIKPVLSLKSKVIFTKKVKKGAGVSYGRTYIAKTSRHIATVAVGYADGYPWALSNRAKVLIKGKFFDVAGRVCMDHIMIDLKNRGDIKAGEEVILLGESKGKSISCEDLAQWSETIPYEILTRLSVNIPRIHIN
ncbi:MAG: alanine racemase [Candidatus Omnitrophica bacterium]|nr:alanine racemase [Candidatus Omnitrophota bacterium]